MYMAILRNTPMIIQGKRPILRTNSNCCLRYILHQVLETLLSKKESQYESETLYLSLRKRNNNLCNFDLF